MHYIISFFLSLITGVSGHGKESNLVTPEMWKKHAFFLSYDFSKDKQLGFNDTGSETGTISVQYVFPTGAPSVDLVVVYYGSYRDTLSINGDKEIFTNEKTMSSNRI